MELFLQVVFDNHFISKTLQEVKSKETSFSKGTVVSQQTLIGLAGIVVITKKHWSEAVTLKNLPSLYKTLCDTTKHEN